MENATKRLRKARRQGLSGRGVGRSRTVSLGGPNRLQDMERTAQPNRRRKSTVTQRKAKRGQTKAPRARSAR